MHPARLFVLVTALLALPGSAFALDQAPATPARPGGGPEGPPPSGGGARQSCCPLNNPSCANLDTTLKGACLVRDYTPGMLSTASYCSSYTDTVKTDPSMLNSGRHWPVLPAHPEMEFVGVVAAGCGGMSGSCRGGQGCNQMPSLAGEDLSLVHDDRDYDLPVKVQAPEDYRWLTCGNMYGGGDYAGGDINVESEAMYLFPGFRSSTHWKGGADGHVRNGTLDLASPWPGDIIAVHGVLAVDCGHFEPNTGDHRMEIHPPSALAWIHRNNAPDSYTLHIRAMTDAPYPREPGYRGRLNQFIPLPAQVGGRYVRLSRLVYDYVWSDYQIKTDGSIGLASPNAYLVLNRTAALAAQLNQRGELIPSNGFISIDVKPSQPGGVQVSLASIAPSLGPAPPVLSRPHAKHRPHLVGAHMELQLCPGNTPCAPWPLTVPPGSTSSLDFGTQRQNMHACPPGSFMTGVHVDRNLLQCTPGFGSPGPERVDTGTQRNGMHACPPGQAMTGLHAGDNRLLCAPLPYAVAAEFEDRGTQRPEGDFSLHVCPPDSVQTGIHVDQNRFLCARLAMPSPGSPPCVPQCDGKKCNEANGCGGTCGCSGGQVCEPGGQCVQPPACVPHCEGKSCLEDNGCGEACGCAKGQVCNNDTGACQANTCGGKLVPCECGGCGSPALCRRRCGSQLGD